MAKQTEYNVSLEDLARVAGVIGELDTKIGAISGSDSAIRKSIAETVAAENSEQVGSIHDNVIGQLGKLDAPVLVGLVTRLQDSIKSAFQEQIDAFLTEKVKEATKDSQGDVTALREQRKTQVETFRALKVLLEQVFHVDTTSVPEPKRSGGGRPAGSGSAKSGKNKESYQYTMDGKDRPPSQNTFSSLAYYSTNGCAGTKEKPERWGAAQLKEFLVSQSVNFGADDTWDVELPNGTKIGARRVEQTEAPAEAAAEESVPA